MAEEDVSYASVVFKTKKNPPPVAIKEEETVYDEVNMRGNISQPAVDKNDKGANNRRGHFQQVACAFGITCVILLMGIVAVSVYLTTLSHENDTSELSQLKDNQTTLLAENHNLTNLNNKLISENENLRRDHNDLKVQFDNLTLSYNVSESKITNLTVENQDLKAQWNNLTQQLRNMQTNLNELNVTRAQWSINAYCPKQQTGRKCEPCQDGWLLSQSSCYAINDPEPKDQKTWEEAQQNCIGKNSDLAVVLNDKEKRFISDKSWGSSGTNGYWIGLRVEGGTWKWLDGRNLTKSSWIQRPPEKDHCAISVKDRGWESVSCSVKHRWICKKAALSV
ncbi:C-type lectin domain family 12 member B isoform X2 [Xiphias gladius]|uniref:C-type lectin domain family 12 member B isoform X2 n=1 Tax=Xiphias gladius TaxID=8245 RepID=UPI001A99E48D|nr:C-type lectin domain family 12 member B isoform X2 [Xiphias gladius]